MSDSMIIIDFCWLYRKNVYKGPTYCPKFNLTLGFFGQQVSQCLAS